MELKQDMLVVTSDGEGVGSLKRVVLDPETNEVTHVVAEKGLLLRKDRLIAVHLIDHSEDDRLILRDDVDDPDSLPEFQETEFVAVTEPVARSGPAERQIQPVYWYPSVGTAWWGAGTGGYTSVPAGGMPFFAYKTELHIAEGTIPLREGARVVSEDGEHVGDVEQVITGPDGEQVSHVVISRGLLLKEHKLVPVTWISRLGEDHIRLSVDAHQVQSLPDYEE